MEAAKIWVVILVVCHHLSFQFIGSDSRNVCRYKRDRDSICSSYPGWDGSSEGKAVLGNLLSISSGHVIYWTDNCQPMSHSLCLMNNKEKGERIMDE